MRLPHDGDIRQLCSQRGNSSVPNSGRHSAPIIMRTTVTRILCALTHGNRSKLGDPPMDTINLPDDIDHHRRHFFGTAALAIAAAQLALTGSANAQSATTPQPGSKKPAALAAT